MRRHRALLTAFLLIGLAACGETTTPTGLPQGSYSRIVTLAPNLTELVFWAGAGERLVGVSAYSNHPPAALDLPVVGDAFMIDQERLAVLEPDLLLVWEGGTPAHVIDELGALGYRVEAMRTNSVADVARTIVRIGEQVIAQTPEYRGFQFGLGLTWGIPFFDLSQEASDAGVERLELEGGPAIAARWGS